MLILVLAGSVPLAHASGTWVVLSLLLPLALGAWIGGVGLPSRWAAPPVVRQGLFALAPLVWGLMLAQHLGLSMSEAGALLQVSLAPWLGDKAASLPAWRADPRVIAFCKNAALLGAGIWSPLMVRLLLAGRRRLQLITAVAVVGAAIWGR